MTNDKLLSALNSLDVATMTHAEWISVGMALKHEGYPCSVWDDWSKPDTRYHNGECAKKWESFKENGSKIVTGGTIIKMAQDRGWKMVSWDGDGVIAWDGCIEYDGDGGYVQPKDIAWNPAQELATYIRTLFKDDEYVAYVVDAESKDDKWTPTGKGTYAFTAKYLLEQIEKYPEDLGAAIGDWNKEAGAWIRFNPVDGKGIANENVTRFSYALIESDDLSIVEQEAVYKKLELPIAALVHSGGKSLHAIVKIDAADKDEYENRVNYLYNFIKSQKFVDKNGEEKFIKIDGQNKNPSRLSRMPGVTRGNQKQRLIATNIGRSSWTDWMDFVEGTKDELPDIIPLASYNNNLPPLPDTLIDGILRQGHKMLISGASKSGKSFLLMELCIAIAEGEKWIDTYQCKKGKVLYLNLEIDPASAIHRFKAICDAMGKAAMPDGIDIWNLRGHAVPLTELTPKLIRRVHDHKYSAIVFDPIYKIITGDENDASDMGKFCNEFDKVCDATGASAIYCHHHSKGAQGMKKAQDRASGSGVFARDPDAQLDIISLSETEDYKLFMKDGKSSAWEMSSSLREFPNITPLRFTFEYPLHKSDRDGLLNGLAIEGSWEAGQQKNKNSRTHDSVMNEFRTAFDALSMGQSYVTIHDLANYLSCSDKTIYTRVKRSEGEFFVKDGCVRMADTVRLE